MSLDFAPDQPREVHARRRIVVAGARGFFGSKVLDLLRRGGRHPIAASRGGAGDLRLDVEDRGSIRAALQAGAVLVDATAPFQRRTTALIEEAIAIGFDVVDLCDSLDYARRVAACDDAANARGIRILNCCSAVSVLSAAALELSGIAEPERVHGFLAPATRHTANAGVVRSFLASVGAPIAVWRDGTWRRARGWSESRDFVAIGRRGRLIESADSFALPRAFPSLRDADFWVDANTRGAPAALAIARRVPAIVPLLSALVRYAGPLMKLAGRDESLLAYEVHGATAKPVAQGFPPPREALRRDLDEARRAKSGSPASPDAASTVVQGPSSVAQGVSPAPPAAAPDHSRVTVIFRGRDAFLIAAIPAALAAERLAAGTLDRAGVIPVNRQLEASTLRAALERHGIQIVSLAGSEASRVE